MPQQRQGWHHRRTRSPSTVPGWSPQVACPRGLVPCSLSVRGHLRHLRGRYDSPRLLWFLLGAGNQQWRPKAGCLALDSPWASVPGKGLRKKVRASSLDMGILSSFAPLTRIAPVAGATWEAWTKPSGGHLGSGEKPGQVQTDRTPMDLSAGQFHSHHSSFLTQPLGSPVTVHWAFLPTGPSVCQWFFSEESKEAERKTMDGNKGLPAGEENASRLKPRECGPQRQAPQTALTKSQARLQAEG